MFCVLLSDEWIAIVIADDTLRTSSVVIVSVILIPSLTWISAERHRLGGCFFRPLLPQIISETKSRSGKGEAVFEISRRVAPNPWLTF